MYIMNCNYTAQGELSCVEHFGGYENKKKMCDVSYPNDQYSSKEDCIREQCDQVDNLNDCIAELKGEPNPDFLVTPENSWITGSGTGRDTDLRLSRLEDKVKNLETQITQTR